MYCSILHWLEVLWARSFMPSSAELLQGTRRPELMLALLQWCEASQAFYQKEYKCLIIDAPIEI